MTSPSIVLHGPGDARLEHLPIPTLTSPTDVIVQIAYVGVCGSDVHLWTHGGIGSKIVTSVVMGHEGSGTVTHVGSSVTSLQPGDRVAIEPGRPCRHCTRCKEGVYNLCPSMEFASCPPDTPGLLSKYWKVAADFCYKLPQTVTLAEGVFAEPLAVAAHAVRTIDVRPGDRVVVFGAGTIGLLSAAMARYYGASKVVAVDILEQKLEVARRLVSGCEGFVPDLNASHQENAARIVEMFGLGLGADKVIEATGAESCTNMAIYVLRMGGHMVQTGLGRPLISFPIIEFSEKEIHMHGAFRYGPGDFAIAMEALERKIVPFDQLIAKIFPFEEATAAWEATRRGEGIKNIIQGVA